MDNSEEIPCGGGLGSVGDQPPGCLGNSSVRDSAVWSLFQHELSRLHFSIIHP